MSKKKTTAQQRKQLAVFAKFVQGTLRQMAKGESVKMIVHVIKTGTKEATIQTVSGNPVVPHPPKPGSKNS